MTASLTLVVLSVVVLFPSLLHCVTLKFSPTTCANPCINFSVVQGAFSTSSATFYYVDQTGYKTAAGNLTGPNTVEFKTPSWTFEFQITLPTPDKVLFDYTVTNTGNSTSPIPQHGFGPLSGSWFNASEGYAWAFTQSDPLIFASQISDGSWMSLTCEDYTLDLVIELQKTTNPYTGLNIINVLPSGGNYDRDYNLGMKITQLQPKQNARISWSLNFGPTKDSVSLGGYQAWAKAYPYSLNWPDRRLMMRGDLFQYNPQFDNPQGFAKSYDINNSSNFGQFAKDVMEYARNMVDKCKTLNVGAWIEWEIEGCVNLAFKYTGNPHMIEQNPGWAQQINGTTLFRNFVKVFTDAGIHFGVTIRPWTLIYNPQSNSLAINNSVDDLTSIANHIDFAYENFGIDVFYYDSPSFLKTPDFRKMFQSRPHVLVIPEYAPESWLQFSAPMVWDGPNVINWFSVPRNIYGDKGWGVYFHQTTAGYMDRLLADAKKGSTLLEDNGWFATIPDLQNRTAPIATANYPFAPAGKFAQSGKTSGSSIRNSGFFGILFVLWLCVVLGTINSA